MKKYLILFPLALISVWRLFAASPQGVNSEVTVSVGNASTQILAANPNGAYVKVQNNGGSTCQVKVGAAIVTITDGFSITAGSFFDVYGSYIKSPIFAKCPAGFQPIEVLNSNW